MAEDVLPAPTLASLACDLRAGRRTSRQLVEDCLLRIEIATEEERCAFLSIYADRARAAADRVDARRERTDLPTPYAGIPISIKDLFDVAGEVTTAGSRVLAEARPANTDAAVVQRVQAAGFILIGRTNMTEFAYSGLGVNPHFGTPSIAGSEQERTVPGGSSAGAAVSVRLGMAHGSIGTDTGGSCRIPAAFCDVVGWKPTAGRVPLDGTVPLSTSLDSIGPIARSVGCCAILDAVMAGSIPRSLATRSLDGLRLLVPTTLTLDDMDEHVASRFGRFLDLLSRHGVRITEAVMPEIAEAHDLNAAGGLTAIESFAWHRQHIRTKAELYDPRILQLIKRGENATAADYIDLMRSRHLLKARAHARLSLYDAMLMPTVPIAPPTLGALSDVDEYTRLNRLVLRNSFIVNMMDGCALSLPIDRSPGVHVSVTLGGVHGADREVLEIAQAVERLVEHSRSTASSAQPRKTMERSGAAL